jgi:protein-arginine deiminase
VDEVVTFVPAPTGRGFKLLIASPRRAWAILRAARRSHPSARMMIGRTFLDLHGAPTRPGEVTLDEFFRAGVPGLGLTAHALRAWNLDRVQERLDDIERAFAREIAATRAEIIHVPVLFMPNEGQPNLADAMTAGMVNMLVVNGHCAVPKPFGPVVGGVDLFEQDLRRRLSGLGLTLTFVDDWDTYHVRLGEVHCGTNTLRRPASPPRWWVY